MTQATFLCSATEPGTQNASNPIPIASAASEAEVTPFSTQLHCPKYMPNLHSQMQWVDPLYNFIWVEPLS